MRLALGFTKADFCNQNLENVQSAQLLANSASGYEMHSGSALSVI